MTFGLKVEIWNWLKKGGEAEKRTIESQQVFDFKIWDTVYSGLEPRYWQCCKDVNSKQPRHLYVTAYEVWGQNVRDSLM